MEFYVNFSVELWENEVFRWNFEGVINFSGWVMTVGQFGSEF